MFARVPPDSSSSLAIDSRLASNQNGSGPNEQLESESESEFEFGSESESDGHKFWLVLLNDSLTFIHLAKGGSGEDYRKSRGGRNRKTTSSYKSHE